VAAYRADIEIGVKGLRQVDALKTKVEQLSKAITDIAFKRFALNDTLLRKSAFFVAQEQKLVAARQQYNDGIRESVRLAVQFQNQLERSALFAAKVRQQSARALPQASIAGLLPSQATATPFRTAERKATRIDTAYAKLAAAAEGTASELIRVGTEARAFKALPAAGQATVNYFQIAETAARTIDKQNATAYRYEKALAKLATAAEGTIGSFVRIQAGAARFAGLLAPANIAGLLPYGLPTGGQKRLPPGRIAGYLPPAGGFTPEMMTRQQAFPVSGPIPLNQYGQTRRSAAAFNLGQSIRGRAGGAIGNAVIGGSFPLLFGQGGGAAAGGAIGGLVGGAFGGVGGFAGSLVGTLLGEIASKGQAVKQLAEDLGFSAEQTNQLATAFKVANTDVEKFTAVIQNVRGLGLELEGQAELIKLVTRLTNVYGGSFEKTGNAITSALEAGKVTQATLNQLTSQGINIQEQLATKFGVSRDALLEMAKKGKIGIQDLVNALVEMGNKGVEATKKPLTGMERLGQATKNLGSALGSLGGAIATALAPPLNWLAGKLASIINLATTGIQYVARLIGGGTKLENQAAAMAAAQLIKENPSLRSQRGGGPRGTNLIVQNGVLTPGAIGRLSPQMQARYQQLYGKATTTIQQPKINNIDVSGLGQTAPAPGPKGAAGPKPPEDRTAQLLEDLKAMERISKAQDDMRNALFEGNKLNAIDLDYVQKIADIERDTAKSLLNANYASEKDVYLKQQAVRLADVTAVRLDEVRQLERDITEEYYNRAGLDPRNLTLNQGAGAFDLTLDLDPNSRVVQRFDEMRKRLEELQDPINMATRGAESIGNAFSDAFTSIVTGTQSVQQALANFFKGVGTAFVDMASQIIAQMLTMYAFKQLLNIFGGTSTGLFTGGGPVSGASVFGGGQAGFNPAAFTKGLTFSPGAKFAEGGFVTGPTRALIGEGGQSEYVIPASKMRSAMTRYAAGARGSSVIPSGSGDGPGAGGTMTAAPIDVRYTVERINSVDYVTADQFQAGMRQAASQGAERGQQLALRRLQQSPSARRRVGI